MDIYTICKSLNLNGELKSYDVITAGNINTTYHVVTKSDKKLYEYYTTYEKEFKRICK